MIPQIISVVKPDIDLIAFIKNAESVLGFHPLKQANKLGHELSKDAKLIMALSVFIDPGSHDPLYDLRNAGLVLRHLTYSFLVAADREILLEVVQNTQLVISHTPPVEGNLAAFITGNLYEWRAASLELCSDGSSRGARILLDKILLHFEQLGLGDLWANYNKIRLKDSTLKLESK